MTYVLKNKELRTLVKSNQRTTIFKFSRSLDVNVCTISNHLKCIDKRKKIDKWISHELVTYQFLKRIKTYSSIILCDKNDLF